MALNLFILCILSLRVSSVSAADTKRLSVYGPVPGLSPSPFYSVRLREEKKEEEKEKEEEKKSDEAKEEDAKHIPRETGEEKVEEAEKKPKEKSTDPPESQFVHLGPSKQRYTILRDEF